MLYAWVLSFWTFIFGDIDATRMGLKLLDVFFLDPDAICMVLSFWTWIA